LDGDRFLKNGQILDLPELKAGTSLKRTKGTAAKLAVIQQTFQAASVGQSCTGGTVHSRPPVLQ